MITQTNVIALAYKRYITDIKNRKTAEEMFTSSFSQQAKGEMFLYFKNLCEEMDNNTNVPILEEIKQNIINQKHKKLIDNVSDEIMQTTKIKHKWDDIFLFIERQMIECGFRKSTIKEKKAKIKYIFDKMNIEYIEDVTKEDAIKIKNMLLTQPKNHSKKKLPPVSTFTFNSYILSVSKIYQVANENELYDKNPFQNLKIKNNKTKIKENKENQYHPFTSKDLKKIFNPETYPTPDNVDDFFIPLISLCQGMRANEICQLTTDDIVRINKNKYAFFIHEDENRNKKVKTCSSKRLIPIHPILERLGFVDYIKKMKIKNRKGKLFSKCYLDSRGYFSQYITKKFINYLKILKIKTKNKVFHSFRHNFRTNCANHKYSSEISNALGGWMGRNVGECYANNFEFKDLYKAIKNLEIPELNCLIQKYRIVKQE